MALYGYDDSVDLYGQRISTHDKIQYLLSKVAEQEIPNTISDYTQSKLKGDKALTGEIRSKYNLFRADEPITAGFGFRSSAVIDKQQLRQNAPMKSTSGMANQFSKKSFTFKR